MTTSVRLTPTEMRQNAFFSGFKTSKRIVWTTHRKYNH